MQLDLRSDTVTRPTSAMRAAMAAAPVGDDVLGEDPSVNTLEARCAALTGKEAALFVPSGTMGNLLACHTHTQPGEEIVLERGSHIYRYEGAGFAASAGVSMAFVPGERGKITAAAIPSAIRPPEDDLHQPRTSLLWLENTHNYGGGTCYSIAELQALRAVALEHNLALHIDGARLWNASIAMGYSVREVADQCDSLAMCFSKGLGCPVGSILVGDHPFIRNARKLRKRFGGGMRQAGILAAAALFALDHHVTRLADDHRRAKRLADELGRLPQLTVDPVETNLIFVSVQDTALDAAELHQRLQEQGLLSIMLDPQRIRLVTHLDVDDAGIAHACQVFKQVLGCE